MNELTAGLLEGTFLLAPGILCLTVLSVWLGWRPVPQRGARGRRFAVALPVALVGVVGLYALGALNSGAGADTGVVLLLSVPAATFFVVGMVAVAVIYFRRERVSILRLMATWIFATMAAFIVIVVGYSLFALANGMWPPSRL